MKIEFKSLIVTNKNLIDNKKSIPSFMVSINNM